LRPTLFTALGRGLRGRCPQCGLGKLYSRWNELNEVCAVCGCRLRAREDETWFFMYFSTAAMTGVFIVAMFLVVPADTASARWAIAVLALMLFLSTTGPRKGLAIAFDFFVDSRSKFPRN